MRVEFDGGVLVTAFVAPGSEEEARYRQALEGQVELVTSASSLWTVATVLVERLGWDPVTAEHAVAHIARAAADVSEG